MIRGYCGSGEGYMIRGFCGRDGVMKVVMVMLKLHYNNALYLSNTPNV